MRQLDGKGRDKMRCIDDFLQNRVNEACNIHGRIRMDTLQDLLDIMRLVHAAHPGGRGKLSKSDFKSAYRQCPVCAAHYPFAGLCIADPSEGCTYVGTQCAMPFGAVAAVYAWDRVGAAVTAILRVYLGLPVLRFVDDFFWYIIDGREPSLAQRTFAREARQNVLDVVGALGFGLDPAKTPDPAALMAILGVAVRCPRPTAATLAAELALDPVKAKVWLQSIDLMFKSTALPFEGFEALIGRFSSAAFVVFGRWASSHMSSLYAALASGRPGEGLTQDARDYLLWWQDMIRGGSTLHPLYLHPSAPAFFLTDAEGSGGVGGVLWDTQRPLEECSRFVSDVPRACRDTLAPRKTQINAFELITVLVACRLWPSHLQGRRVIIFIDNHVAMHVLHKGRPPKPDLNVWARRATHLFRALKCHVSFVWAPSKYNMADLPSRRAAVPFGRQVDCPAELRI